MKFTLSWLKEHLETDKSLAEIADAMTMAGLEIEHIDNPADRLAAFTVAHVKDAVPHPDADKLRVCTVETVDGIKQNRVRRAQCARWHDGDLCTARRLYSGPRLCARCQAAQDSRRGKPRHALCSTKELEAGEDHDGIADLTGDWGRWHTGCQSAGARMIRSSTLKSRPNRGLTGSACTAFARDLAAAGVGTFKDAEIAPVEGAHSPAR